MARSFCVAALLAGLAALGGCQGCGKDAAPAAGAASAAPGVAGDSSAGSAAPAGAPTGAPAAVHPVVVDWVDPEPPEVQALAEQVAGAAWNADKTTSLAPPESTPLSMTMTTLVDRRTGVAGFASAIAAKETGVDERLARLQAEQTATEVRIRLAGSVLFDFDSAAIRPDAERTLADVVAVLESYAGRPIRVEGHTDSIASDEYNQKLSLRRADAVAKWFAAHGVKASRMKTAGFGESKPIADNATPEGRQQNRRVEIVVEKTG